MGRASARVVLLAALLAAPAPVSAELQVSTEPARIVLGQVKEVLLKVKGLPGKGPVGMAVNIGRLVLSSDGPGGQRIRWTPPRKRFPQVLCLALWRTHDASGVHLLRVPLLGHKKVRVGTRRHSSVVLQIGEQRFGPASSGNKGSVRIPVVVPPGVRGVQVEVTDSKGLVSRRRIRVRRGRYNQLTVAAVPERAAEGGIQARLVVVAAQLPRRAPRARVGKTPLPLQPAGVMRWEAVWRPPEPSASSPAALRVWIPGDRYSVWRLKLSVPDSLPELPTEPPQVVAEGPAELQPEPEQPRTGQLGLSLALSAGMLHNLGSLFGPLLSAELGLDFRLPVGRLGLRLSGGISWASQSIASPAGLDDAASSIWLVPLTAGLVYTLDRWRVAPYVAGGFLAQLVWSSGRAPYLMQDQEAQDFAPGAFGLLGAGLRLGPGSVFLEAGYLWSRLDTPRLALTAGGLTVQAGYRFQIVGQ